jgi:hypothetical protein
MNPSSAQEIPNINGEVNVAFMRISETLLGIFIAHAEFSMSLSWLNLVYKRLADVLSEETALTHEILREFHPADVTEKAA